MAKLFKSLGAKPPAKTETHACLCCEGTWDLHDIRPDNHSCPSCGKEYYLIVTAPGWRPK